jgi:hypothetical protein
VLLISHNMFATWFVVSEVEFCFAHCRPIMEPSRDQDLEQTTIALWQTPILLFLRILKLESLSIPPFLLATLFFFAPTRCIFL